MSGYSRRKFLTRASCGAMSVVVGARSLQAAVSGNDLDEFIEAEMQGQRIPGLAACIVKSGKIVWSKGYGWSSVKRRLAMDPDRTIQNIGSISKTVTATAVMQLWEKGRFELDDDINNYLPFSVRNPSHPDKPISFRCLLTHRSSIADSPAYMSSYACGDPRVSLETWIKDYFIPDGRYYRREANFHPWSPGKKHRYSNLGFGLLGYLVEKLSGESFTNFTKRTILDPLGMKTTGWMLSEIASESHAVPYVPVNDGQVNKVLQAYKRIGILGGEVERDVRVEDLVGLRVDSHDGDRDCVLVVGPVVVDGDDLVLVHRARRGVVTHSMGGSDLEGDAELGKVRGVGPHRGARGGLGVRHAELLGEPRVDDEGRRSPPEHRLAGRVELQHVGLGCDGERNQAQGQQSVHESLGLRLRRLIAAKGIEQRSCRAKPAGAQATRDRAGVGLPDREGSWPTQVKVGQPAEIRR